MAWLRASRDIGYLSPFDGGPLCLALKGRDASQ